MLNRNDPVFTLCAEFINLRQRGTNRDDAWYKVLELAGKDLRIQDSDVKRLLALAKDWERREGHKYHYRNNADVLATHIGESVIKPLTPSNQTAIKPLVRPANLTGELNPAVLRDYEKQRMEQVLDAVEPPQTVRPRVGTTPIKPQAAQIPPGYFTESSVLLIFGKGYPEPLKIHLDNNVEKIIGRHIPGSAMSPEIDLAPLGAETMGISRMHAAIILQKNAVLIADIGSTNGTYINGKLLLPQEIRALQDQDEIWFGQLVCRIRFHHPYE